MATRTEPSLKGDIVINSVRYSLWKHPERGPAFWREGVDEDQEGKMGQAVQAVWDKGWYLGGMGETVRVSKESMGYAFSDKMTAGQPHFSRFSPRVVTATPTQSPSDAPTYFLEEEDSGGTKNCFAFCGRYGWQFTVTSHAITVVDEFDFGAGAVAGKTDKFEGYWYQPWGSSVEFTQLSHIGPGDITKMFSYITGPTWKDETSDANDFGGSVIAPASWGDSWDDALYWGMSGATFESLYINMTTVAAGGTAKWWYSTGTTTWSELTVTDGTSNLTSSGKVTWTAPGDWAVGTVNSVANHYWVRYGGSTTGFDQFETAPQFDFASTRSFFSSATTGGSTYALCFAGSMYGATAKLARGHSVNQVGLAATLPLTAGSWSGTSEVGDTSAAITNIAETGVDLYVGKEDNLYVYDTTGASYPIFNIGKGTGDSTNGCGMAAVPSTSVCFYNHQTGLKLVTGEDVDTVDSNVNPLHGAISNVALSPHMGRPYETCVASDNWAWSLWRVVEGGTTRTYLDAGWMPAGPRKIIWHPHYNEDAALRGLFADSEMHLWFQNGTDFGFIHLGKNGSPDAGRDAIGYGVGTATTTHYFYLPATDFGYPHTLKQLRAFEVTIRGATTDAPALCQVSRDGAALASVSATTITDSAAAVHKRYWTLGTADTAYMVMPVVKFTEGAGYDETATGDDPQLWKVIVRAILRPDLAGDYHIIVNTGVKWANNVEPPETAKKVRDNFLALEGGAPVACKGLDGESLTLMIGTVSDLLTAEGVNGEILYVLDIKARQFVNV